MRRWSAAPGPGTGPADGFGRVCRRSSNARPGGGCTKAFANRDFTGNTNNPEHLPFSDMNDSAGVNPVFTPCLGNPV